MAAPCLFGLESVLSGELKKIGAKNIEVADGKVTFTGDWSMLAKANIWLRTAERVLIVLDSFRAETFEELFQGVLKIPFEEYLGKEDSFPVKGWSLNSQLSSVPSCQSIIKRAAVKRMEQHYHQSWFAETGAVHRIQFSIRKNIVTIFLDSSGAGLHNAGIARRPCWRRSKKRSLQALSILPACTTIPLSATPSVDPARC